MGGNGSGSSLSRAKGKNRKLKFDRGRSGGQSESLYPAYMNKNAYTGDLDKMASGFGETHGKSDIKYAVTVDQSGYVTGYFKGNKRKRLYSN